MVTITDIRLEGNAFKVSTSNYVIGSVTRDIDNMMEFCKFTGVDLNHLRLKMIECMD